MCVPRQIILIQSNYFMNYYYWIIQSFLQKRSSISDAPAIFVYMINPKLKLLFRYERRVSHKCQWPLHCILLENSMTNNPSALMCFSRLDFIPFSLPAFDFTTEIITMMVGKDLKWNSILIFVFANLLNAMLWPVTNALVDVIVTMCFSQKLQHNFLRYWKIGR